MRIPRTAPLSIEHGSGSLTLNVVTPEHMRYKHSRLYASCFCELLLATLWSGLLSSVSSDLGGERRRLRIVCEERELMIFAACIIRR
jgi:hypothetical protein